MAAQNRCFTLGNATDGEEPPCSCSFWISTLRGEAGSGRWTPNPLVGRGVELELPWQHHIRRNISEAHVAWSLDPAFAIAPTHASGSLRVVFQLQTSQGIAAAFS